MSGEEKSVKQWSDVVELIATDTSNISRTRREQNESVVINEWMQYFSGQRLWVKFIDEDGEPEIAFIPHSDSEVQMTLKVDRIIQSREKSLVWSRMVVEASRESPQIFPVRYCYQPLDE